MKVSWYVNAKYGFMGGGVTLLFVFGVVILPAISPGKLKKPLIKVLRSENLAAIR